VPDAIGAQDPRLDVPIPIENPDRLPDPAGPRSLSASWLELSDARRGGISLSDCASRLCYTVGITWQVQTRVKLNRVFFPRYLFQDRSLGCGFARW